MVTFGGMVKFVVFRIRSWKKCVRGFSYSCFFFRPGFRRFILWFFVRGKNVFVVFRIRVFFFVLVSVDSFSLCLKAVCIIWCVFELIFQSVKNFKTSSKFFHTNSSFWLKLFSLLLLLLYIF